MGLGGLVVGGITIFVLGFIGAFTMARTYQAASASSMVTLTRLTFLGGAIFYFAGPFLLPFIIVACVEEGAKQGKCRSPWRAQFASLVIVAVAGLLIWLLVPFYVNMATTAQTLSDMRGAAMGLYFPVTAVIAYYAAGRAIRRAKFCEHCMNYLREKVVGYYPLDDLQAVLLTLCTGSSAVSGGIHVIGTGDSKVKAKNWIKAVQFTCDCKTHALLEVYANVGQETPFAKPTIFEKLMFSGRIDERICRVLRGM